MDILNPGIRPTSLLDTEKRPERGFPTLWASDTVVADPSTTSTLSGGGQPNSSDETTVGDTSHPPRPPLPAC